MRRDRQPIKLSVNTHFRVNWISHPQIPLDACNTSASAAESCKVSRVVWCSWLKRYISDRRQFISGKLLRMWLHTWTVTALQASHFRVGQIRRQRWKQRYETRRARSMHGASWEIRRQRCHKTHSAVVCIQISAAGSCPIAQQHKQSISYAGYRETPVPTQHGTEEKMQFASRFYHIFCCISYSRPFKAQLLKLVHRAMQA